MNASPDKESLVESYIDFASNLPGKSKTQVRLMCLTDYEIWEKIKKFDDKSSLFLIEIIFEECIISCLFEDLLYCSVCWIKPLSTVCLRNYMEILNNKYIKNRKLMDMLQQSARIEIIIPSNQKNIFGFRIRQGSR